MRNVVAIPLAFILTGCWPPGLGQLDPTRYPWDQRNRQVARPPDGNYCIVTLEAGSATGIMVGGQNVMELECRQREH